MVWYVSERAPKPLWGAIVLEKAPISRKRARSYRMGVGDVPCPCCVVLVGVNPDSR